MCAQKRAEVLLHLNEASETPLYQQIYEQIRNAILAGQVSAGDKLVSIRKLAGDLGVSLVSGEQARTPVRDLKPHIPKMEGFHRRYMVSNKILRLWVRMARQLDIAMLVPQHGAPIVGRQAIGDFFDWLESLMCGIDLFDDRAYQFPGNRIDPATRLLRPAPPASAQHLT